ncbi:hypothetical protein PABG_05156 [Paracoccidioides brasiliensis Pb03]|nr:hypothetical protein PABG_05156 [Paracoccidioides brasiliensis Pb03]
MQDGKSTGAGLVNLEAELSCSICTDILYQPLTLLDCLHTFCGVCLKEWFSWQVSHPPSSSKSAQATCPSCRAAIRDTRHDAKVTTLLDLFLESNPHRARGAEERKELEWKYKPGETILPVRPPNAARMSDSEGNEEDRRLLEDFRQMSLRDADRRHTRVASASRTSPSRTRSRTSGNREADRQEEAQGRRRHAWRAASQEWSSPVQTSNTRRIEHQASLRSLLDTSDGESVIEEEILRQIIDEGLLDGIDIRSLDTEQEDELSERIAEAYRKRHLRRSIAHQSTHSEGEGGSRYLRNRQPRSNSDNERPPVSRPHLLEAPVPRTRSSNHQQRSSSDRGVRRRATSPSPRTAASSAEALIQPTARHSNDLSTRRSSHANSSSEPVRHRTALPLSSPRQSGESEQRARQTGIRSTDRRQVVGTPNSTSSITTTSPQIGSSSQLVATPPSMSVPQSSERLPLIDGRDATIPSSSTRSSSSRPTSSRSDPATHSNESLFSEPSISCNRCDKRNIQYEVYKSCTRCGDGNYNLCLLCYRLGRGCLHWFGFGDSAQALFEEKYPTRVSVVRERPHVLQSRKYLRPQGDAAHTRPRSSRRRTSDDPVKRFQSGLFCDMCQSFADDCFWICSTCNEGEWGFCNSCVNQGNCCTHALLPIARVREADLAQSRIWTSPSATSQPPGTASSHILGSTIAIGSDRYRPLTFSTQCNNCSYPIPPSTSRFHCTTCNIGDYDLCTNCYLKLRANGKISKDNGPNGWRRCLQGHRMLIVGFEDHADGQRRVVVKDIVGGHALRDELVGTANANPSTHPSASFPKPTRQDSGDWMWKDEGMSTSTTHRRRISRSRAAWSNSSPTTPTEPTAETPFSTQFPPSGGIGLRLVALWSYYPDLDVTDEILFPRGAEITEAENINDDWMWGCYAGQMGLFPGGYVRDIREMAGLESRGVVQGGGG